MRERLPWLRPAADAATSEAKRYREVLLSMAIKRAFTVFLCLALCLPVGLATPLVAYADGEAVERAEGSPVADPEPDGSVPPIVAGDLFAEGEDAPDDSGEASDDGSGFVNADMPLASIENSWRYSEGELTFTERDWGDGGMLALRYGGSNLPEGAQRWGIDVSEHQKRIDWDRVKAAGVDFAIIRCGYGDDVSYQDDRQWKRNVAECERLGIPYGVYLYSYAYNAEMARSEADHALRLLEGHDPTYPVYYDLEDNSALEEDADFAELASIFCGTLADAGYKVGVYANLNWWNNHLTDPVFDQWERWVAQYNTTCHYKGEYRLWQATSSGSVDGIEGRVDINYEFNCYPWDVNHTDWYVTCGAFDYVYENKLMSGYADGNFGPYDSITRGQVATVLHNMAGKPSVYSSSFSDVDYSAYYGDAIRWARAYGVVNGYGNNTFVPDALVTREELCAMLANYAGRIKGLSTFTSGAKVDSKADGHAVSSWARGSVGWCLDRGIISGIDEGGVAYLRPQDGAWRASVAAMATVLHRDL